MSSLHKLQRLINKTAKHGEAYYYAQHDLNEHCREVYGFEPGERDADGIIDKVFGGCGVPATMTAEEFDAIMLGLK